jgi:hypothetical protein
MRSIARASRARPRGLALGAALALVLALLLCLTPLAAADSRDAGSDDGYHLAVAALAGKGDGVVFQFGEDAVIDPGERANAVVAVGGDVLVDGTVDVAVAVGGDVTVVGTVEETIVAVGGDVKLKPTAAVGSEAKDGDAAVVLVGGRLYRDEGAQLLGDTTTVKGAWVADALRSGVWDPLINPFGIGSLLWNLVWTIVWVVLAIIVVAIAPRQVRAVGDTLLARPLASLGWGALTGFIILPVSIVLITITIIGLLIVVPGVIIGLPLLYVFTTVSLAAFIGTQVLRGSDSTRGNLMLAAVIGVIIINVVRLIPIAGGIIMFVAGLITFGALVLAVADWQRRRREARRLAVAAGAQPPAPGAPPAGGAPYGIPPAGPQSTPPAGAPYATPPAPQQPDTATLVAPPADPYGMPAATAGERQDTTDLFADIEEAADSQPVAPVPVGEAESTTPGESATAAAAPPTVGTGPATPPPAVGTMPPAAPAAPPTPDKVGEAAPPDARPTDAEPAGAGGDTSPDDKG